MLYSTSIYSTTCNGVGAVLYSNVLSHFVTVSRVTSVTVSPTTLVVLRYCTGRLKDGNRPSLIAVSRSLGHAINFQYCISTAALYSALAFKSARGVRHHGHLKWSGLMNTEGFPFWIAPGRCITWEMGGGPNPSSP